LSTEPTQLQFDDNTLLPLLFGQHDENLLRLEQQLGVSLSSFGNQVRVSGPRDSREVAEQALAALYARLKKGLNVGEAEVDAAVRLASEGRDSGSVEALYRDDLTLVTRKRKVTPRSPAQAAYIKALMHKELVFGIGPAGTGKTYLAVATAVSLLLAGKVDRLILSRPAVEAGERLGFLPGDMKDKVDPYLRPLYDALHDMMPGEQVIKRLETGEIEIAPLAFMRGRTLANAFVILDEAQNTTPVQMKMFLTRLGENSRMAVTGDLSQVDLPRDSRSGLRDAVDLLAGIDRVGFVQFTDADVVRHSLVTRIVQAYDSRDKARQVEADLFAQDGEAETAAPK
jgi:phosphate starvation-inducible PhoH-like protein